MVVAELEMNDPGQPAAQCSEYKRCIENAAMLLEKSGKAILFEKSDKAMLFESSQSHTPAMLEWRRRLR